MVVAVLSLLYSILLRVSCMHLTQFWYLTLSSLT